MPAARYPAVGLYAASSGKNQPYLVWGVSARNSDKSSVMIAQWTNGKISKESVPFANVLPTPLAQPNEGEVSQEGATCIRT